MPVVTIEGSGVQDLDKKRKFVKDLTGIVSKYYGLPEDTIIILIKDNSPDNVGSGGRLILDLKH